MIFIWIGAVFALLSVMSLTKMHHASASATHLGTSKNPSMASFGAAYRICDQSVDDEIIQL